MTLPPRAVTVFGLIQIALIMGGWLMVRTFVRVFDEHMASMGLHKIHMPALAVFVRWCGLWFLLVPACWVTAVAVVEGRGRSEGRIDWSSLKAGGLITAALALFFAYAVVLAVQTYVNPFLEW